MIACLIKCDESEMPYTGAQLEEAVHPSISPTNGPGKWTLDLGTDRFVDFSPGPPGLQIGIPMQICLCRNMARLLAMRH